MMLINKKIIIFILIFFVPIILLGFFYFGLMSDQENINVNLINENKQKKEDNLVHSRLPASSSSTSQNLKQKTEFKDTDNSLSDSDFKKQEKTVILQNVPFTSQAPFASWDNPMFQDGCEEASVIMAMRWIQNKELTKEEAKTEIEKISKFELEHDGTYIDRSATSTAWLIKDYYNYNNVKAYLDISIEDIKKELFKGNLVIVPVDGRKLKNPHYTPPGPSRHMIVIIGYDAGTDEFITNDSGTKHGKSYRYNVGIFEKSLRDYPTGDHKPITVNRTAMIVVSSDF